MFLDLADYLPIHTWVAQSRSLPPPPTTPFTDRTILLTGASGAIISLAARTLLPLSPARLILAVPDLPPDDPPAAAPHLIRLLGPAADLSRVHVWPLNLLSFLSTRALAARAAALPRLDAALMGAALLHTDSPPHSRGPDGWDRALQANHLGTALLALLLVPALQASAARHPGAGPGVLSFVSSMGARMCALGLPRPLAGVEAPLLRAVDGAEGYAARRLRYGLTKLLVLWFVRGLAARVGAGEGEGVVVHACDFGVSSGDTGGLATVNWEARLMAWLLGRPAEVCARVVVNSCRAGGGETHGRLMLDYDVVPYPRFMDSEWGREMQAQVWEETRQVLVAVSPEAKELYDSFES